MEIKPEEIQAYKAMMANLQNLVFYADATWRHKHGVSMIADSAFAALTGYQYKAVNDQIDKELEQAQKMLATMTDDEKKEMEMPAAMPERFCRIPQEMRDVLDAMVRNMSSLEEQHQKDAIWRASGPDETISQNRLAAAAHKGYHRVDFDGIWADIEHIKIRRHLLEFKNA